MTHGFSKVLTSKQSTPVEVFFPTWLKLCLANGEQKIQTEKQTIFIHISTKCTMIYLCIVNMLYFGVLRAQMPSLLEACAPGLSHTGITCYCWNIQVEGWNGSCLWMQKPKEMSLAILCMGMAGIQAQKALLAGESWTIQLLSVPDRKNKAFLIVKKDYFVEISFLVLVGREDTEKFQGPMLLSCHENPV